MRKFLLIAAIAFALAAPISAHAQVGAVTTGAVLGGLAGSVYVSGLNATAAAVSSAAATTAAAIGTAAPAVAGAIVAASPPVLVGVIVGGVVGYLLF